MPIAVHDNANISYRLIQKQEQKKGGHIGALSPNLLQEIISYLPFEESPRLDRVCVGFRDAAMQTKLDAEKIIEKELGISLAKPPLNSILSDEDHRKYFYPSTLVNPAADYRRLLYQHLTKKFNPVTNRYGAADVSRSFKDLNLAQKMKIENCFLSRGTVLDFRPLNRTGIRRIVSIPEELGYLKELKCLAIVAPKRSADRITWQAGLQGLEHVKGLESLTIELLADIDHLPNNIGILEELSELIIKARSVRATIESLANLGSLKKLVHLDLAYGCRDFNLISGLSALQQLQSLRIHFCGYRLANKLPVVLSVMPQLKHLIIVSPELPVTLNPLIHIEKLEFNLKSFLTSLSFRYTESLDFSVMQKLTTLIIREDQGVVGWKRPFTPPVVASALLPNLQEVQLLGNSLTASNLEFLKAAINLKKLKIRDNQMEDLPDFILQLTHLQDLDLSGCSKLKAFSPGMQHLIQLEHLNLSGCTVFFKEKEDYLLEFVPQIKRLTLNNLYFFEFPSAVIRLAENKNLQYLNLQDSVSTDQIPDVLLRSGINICSSPDAPQQLTKEQTIRLMSFGKGKRSVTDDKEKETEEQHRPSKRIAGND